MEVMAFTIFICTIMYLDHKWYIRGSEKTLFFKDETDIEKDLREIQRLEIKQRLKELREKDLHE
jgi:hypothetical protein